jgi:hypothetical protein
MPQSSCDYRGKECKKEECKKVVDKQKIRNNKGGQCALFEVITILDDEVARVILPDQKEAIHDLKDKYIRAYNEKNTGRVFEKWVRDKIIQKNKGRVVFGYDGREFRFNVDVAIPSRDKPKVVLEIKILIDAQLTLALKGILDYASDKEMRVGLVLLRKPRPQIKAILEVLKKQYGRRFSCFVLQGTNWCDEIENIKDFI